MNNLSEIYFNIQSRIFPMLEEEIGELTKKQQEFLRIIELVKPSNESGVTPNGGQNKTLRW